MCLRREEGAISALEPGKHWVRWGVEGVCGEVGGVGGVADPDRQWVRTGAWVGGRIGRGRGAISACVTGDMALRGRRL